VASFVPTGTTPSTSDPLPGSTLTEGVADLNALAANPEQYQFLWAITAGAIAPPGQAAFTGGRYVGEASLRAISYATDFRISVPIKVPNC